MQRTSGVTSTQPSGTADVPEGVSRVVTAFRPVPVFDQAQTDGDPLPEVCTRLTGEDARGAGVGLLQLAASLGFTVEDHVFGDDTNGDCTHALRRIRVRLDLTPAHRVKTLCHELAHALLHGDATDRPLAELKAESVAFIVCDALGIDAGTWSFGYVATWSGGGDQAIAAIKAAGARIQRTADRILTDLEAAGDAPTESSACAAPAGMRDAELAELVEVVQP